MKAGTGSKKTKTLEQLQRQIEQLQKQMNALMTREQAFIGARAYNDADIAVNNTTTTALTLNTEAFDVGGLHSVSVNTGRFTIVVPGHYLVGACAQFAANATGYRSLSMRVGGGTVIASVLNTAPSASIQTRLAVASIYHFAESEYVEATVYQTSGGALNVEYIAGYSPVVWCVRL